MLMLAENLDGISRRRAVPVHRFDPAGKHEHDLINDDGQRHEHQDKAQSHKQLTVRKDYRPSPISIHCLGQDMRNRPRL